MQSTKGTGYVSCRESCKSASSSEKLGHHLSSAEQGLPTQFCNIVIKQE